MLASVFNTVRIETLYTWSYRRHLINTLNGVNCCQRLDFIWAPQIEHFHNVIAFPLHCA